MKHLYGIVFSDRNIDSNEKSFPAFQVRDNDAVTKQLLLPNFGTSASHKNHMLNAFILIESIRPKLVQLFSSIVFTC